MIVAAGLDSSAGAGIAADLATIRSLGARPLLAATAISAQTSAAGLLDMMAVPPALIESQFAAAGRECRSPSGGASVKVGMLADVASIETVARLLAGCSGARIVDPVCGPTAGHGWADDKWRQAFMRQMPPVCDLITPNLAEARFLAGLDEKAAPQAAAAALVEAGFGRVLITDSRPDDARLAVDTFFSANESENFRLCGRRFGSGVRGSGCRLASAIAASAGAYPGAASISFAEEIVIGRMHVVAACRGRRAASQPTALLPQVQASWLAAGNFPPLAEPLGLCPITDDPARIGEYAQQGFDSAQLRIKNGSEDQIASAVAAAVAAAGGRLRLFVNDHWRAAAATEGVYGVHLGQQDLAVADLGLIASRRLRLGVSAHGFFELAAARSLRPSYISLGPVFAPNSKKLAALGISRLRQLLAADDLPMPVAIGGIGPGDLARLRRMGISGVACMKAVGSPDAAAAMLVAWQQAAGD